ncbi:MAG: ribbon-helix-helix domain-containing protein, partial [Devosia sp.]
MSAEPDHDEHQNGTALPDAEALRALSETLFRTVTAGSGRHGIRLEQTYWKALDNLSSASGIKRSAYIGHIVQRAHEGGLNASSAVRSVVTDHLLSQNERLAPLANMPKLLTMLQMAPSPSFALDRAKRIVKVNFEFMRYLRSV